MSPQELRAQVKTIVTSKLKRIFDPDKGIMEPELDLIVEEVEQTILNYCRIPRVIPQLRFVWANMVVDLAKFQIEDNYTPEDPMDVIDPSDLSSIKVGDTSVFVGDKYRSNARSRTLQSHEAKLDDIVLNYRAQLNQFRRIV